MGKYFAVVADPHLDVVDSRDTVIKAFVGEQLADKIFQTLVKPKLVRLIIALCFVVAAICGVISLYGTDISWIGYCTISGIPQVALACGYTNIYVLKKLTMEFTFWLLISSHLISGVCMTFMVRFDPARVTGIWMRVICGCTALCLFDARTYTRKLKGNETRNRVIGLYLISSIVFFILTLLYVFDVLNVDYPEIPLFGDVVIPVASIGMSFFQGIGIWLLKCAWTIYRAPKNSNILLIIRADISFYPVDGDNDGQMVINQQQPITDDPSTINNKSTNNSTIIPQSSHVMQSSTSLRLGRIDDTPQTLEHALEINNELKIKLYAAQLRILELESATFNAR
jgi:hypothetical protein